MRALAQEDKLVLECAAKEHLRRLSVIWTSPLSDYNRVVASNQFAYNCLSWDILCGHNSGQWWKISRYTVDRKACKIVVESGGRHPCSSNVLLYLPWNRGRGLRSVVMEYKATKIKGVVRLHGNQDPALRMVRGFEKQAARMGRRSIFKEAAKCAEELGLELDLEHVAKDQVRGAEVSSWETRVWGQKPMMARVFSDHQARGWEFECGWVFLVAHRVEKLSITHNCWAHWATQAAFTTRVYMSQKTHTSAEGEVVCRLCGKDPESVAQNKYLSRHDAALKVLFWVVVRWGTYRWDAALVHTGQAKPVYESENIKAYRDFPVYAEQQEVKCNRVDARNVDHECKRVVTLEMSCPRINNQQRKHDEKTLKYSPLQWELRQQFPGYEVKRYNNYYHGYPWGGHGS